MFDDDNLMENYPLITSNNWFGYDNNNFSENFVPTTNAGEFELKIEEVLQKCHYVSGHVIMNQCGSLLTRKNHRINGFKSQKCFYSGFVQHRCVTPLQYFILKEYHLLTFLCNGT